MTSQHDKPKRWRLRFSVRTLVVVVTLVCLLLAGWVPTAHRGIYDVTQHVDGDLDIPTTDTTADSQAIALFRGDVATVMPFVVGADNFSSRRREYYCWFFGYVAKLPNNGGKAQTAELHDLRMDWQRIWLTLDDPDDPAPQD